MKDLGIDILEAFDKMDLRDQVALWSDISKKLEQNLKSNGFVNPKEIEKI